MARHDARSATLCKPFPERDLPFHHQPLAGWAAGGIRVTAHDLRRGSISAQRSRPYGFARGPVCVPPEWPCDALEAGPHCPQRSSASPVSGDLSTRIGLVEDEGKPSRPKQA